jgi:ABC-type nitrate/sulfonate/bicarbonate transport system permease component
VIPIPAWELKLRDLLERVLLIRPRTKEFLLGHPALVLAGAGLGKGKWWRPYLVTLAAVGQASLLNTFVHLHTPFLISLARSLLGLLLGAAIGSLLTLAGYYLVRGGRRYA